MQNWPRESVITAAKLAMTTLSPEWSWVYLIAVLHPHAQHPTSTIDTRGFPDPGVVEGVLIRIEIRVLPKHFELGRSVMGGSRAITQIYDCTIVWTTMSSRVNG